MWTVDEHLIETWLLQQDEETKVSIFAVLELLEREGPMLRRPLVGEIKHSKYKRMKELRPPSTGRSEARIIFAFDPHRTAVLLLAGDKANKQGLRGGLKWNAWYRKVLPIADELFDQHLRSLE
ncbi:MAG: type II toxin-antitoxin system RelE/ParE family toxin [Bifidobacteriaceae bacterium]|jgi:hypothetical protein|nr:type II toxin-antitoxin system RelE/ParE family toxin [Bifidobacteriaceae bacterium]